MTVIVNGKAIDALASDGYMWFDGRLGPRRIHEVALARAKLIDEKLDKRFIGYQIRKGTLTRFKNLGPVFPINYSTVGTVSTSI